MELFGNPMSDDGSSAIEVFLAVSGAENVLSSTVSVSMKAFAEDNSDFFSFPFVC